MKDFLQHGKIELGKQVDLVCHLQMKICFPDGLLRNQMVWQRLDYKNYLKQLEIIHI